MRAVALLAVLAAGCGSSSPPPKAPDAIPQLPAVAADGSVAAIAAADNDKVRLVALTGGHGRATEAPMTDLPADRVAMTALDSTGEWSGFAGAGATIAMDDEGRRLYVDVDGARVVDAEAPWWSDAFADQGLTHDNGACANESVEIMRAWIAPAQRRVLLAVDVDFPPCQQAGGYYLVAW